MEYFIIIIILSCITFASSIYESSTLNITHQAKNSLFSVLYLLTILFIALGLGLRGNMDEYSIFYLYVPTVVDFISNFEIYGNNERYNGVITKGNQIAYDKGFIFTLIVSVLKSLNLSSQSILIFFSSTSVLIHGYYFKKYTPYVFLALLFYLSHEIVGKEWISIRQALVSAFVLPLIYYVINKKKLKFYFLLIISALIQYLSILSIFLIFFNKRYSLKFILILFILAFLIHFTDIIRLIILNENVFNYLPMYISNYLIDDVHGRPISIFQLKLFQQLVLISILLLNYKKFNQLSYELKYFNILFNTYIFGTLLMIIFSTFSIFAYRFNGHFYAVEPILLTYLLWYFRPKYLIIIGIILLSIVFAYINYVYMEKITSYEFLIRINSLYLIK